MCHLKQADAEAEEEVAAESIDIMNLMAALTSSSGQLRNLDKEAKLEGEVDTIKEHGLSLLVVSSAPAHSSMRGLLRRIQHGDLHSQSRLELLVPRFLDSHYFHSSEGRSDLSHRYQG